MEKYYNEFIKFIQKYKLLLIVILISLILLCLYRGRGVALIYHGRVNKILNHYDKIKHNLRINDKFKDKSIAICLFGIHYQENYKHHRLGTININFEKYVNNIQNFFDGFKTKDYYIVTNNSPIQNKLYDQYDPKMILYTQKGRDYKILMILKYLRDNYNEYDFVAISRIDIFYMIDLYDIDTEKLNMISILERPNLICDNFYLFPYKYLDTMINIFQNIKEYTTHKRIPSHGLKNIFGKTMGINYLKNENTDVWSLTSYYIHI